MEVILTLLKLMSIGGWFQGVYEIWGRLPLWAEYVRSSAHLIKRSFVNYCIISITSFQDNNQFSCSNEQNVDCGRHFKFLSWVQSRGRIWGPIWTSCVGGACKVTIKHATRDGNYKVYLSDGFSTCPLVEFCFTDSYFPGFTTLQIGSFKNFLSDNHPYVLLVRHLFYLL